MTQSSLQAATIMYPNGIAFNYINLSNSSDDLYVSNTRVNLVLPFAGFITTMCNPRMLQFRLYSTYTGKPFIEIFARFPPSNPADYA